MEKFFPRGIRNRSVPLDGVESDLLARALAIWEKARGTRKAPAWKDIDLMSFPALLLPATTVVDVVDGGRDYRYRYWGTGLTQLFGRDETGTFLSQHPVKDSADLRFYQFNQIVAAFAPILSETVFERAEGMLVRKFNLRLPVADTPDTVTKIISLSDIIRVKLRHHEDLADYWSPEDERPKKR